MSSFCFYQGDDQTVADRMRFAAGSVWGDVKEVTRDSFRLFIPSADYSRSYSESRTALGALSGYARCDSLDDEPDERESPGDRHNRQFVSDAIDDDKWPLGADWTGCFGAVAYSKSRREVIVCNDPVGYIPVYYSAGDKGVLGGTSLIVLSRSISCDIDPVGVLERISAPYCNYGRRTLIKQVSRLLPGERVKLSPNGPQVASTFDNELCKGLIDSDINGVARIVWDSLQRETDLALDHEDRVNVALSGGWDSRLALGAVSHRTDSIKCYTFGNGSLHEVRTARRCALAIGAHHEFFPIENTYFPPRDWYEGLIKKTETANQLQWCAIIDAVKTDDDPKDVILMGDLCESIAALNMKQFSTRDARIRSFTRGLVGQADEIAPATDESFARWKEKTGERVIATILRNIDNLSPELADACRGGHVAEEIAGDLELCFSRVRDNGPAFAPMFEELFYWFHRARFLIAGQALFLSSRFRPLCPAVSMRFMRLISSVHPKLRIRRRLMNAIARLPELDLLAGIPSAQIPWLSARAPSLLREIVWGARSGIDQVLIRRAMKNRDPRMRQRVLPTLDYTKEYQRDNAVPNVRAWFSGKWLNGDKYVDIVKRRASLTAWPLMNLDIAAPANVSIILDLCRADQYMVEGPSVLHEVELI
jgi:hypothetical protein